jgi:tetratricopeptide (TPR) repeat protein
MKTEPSSALVSLVRRTLHGNPINIGRVHWLLGAIEGNAGNITESLTCFEQALAIFEQHNAWRYIAIANNDLSDLFLKTSQYRLMLSPTHRSLEIAEKMGHVTLLSLGHGNLGERDLRLGNLAAAETQLRKAIALAEQVNDRPNVSLWSSRRACVLIDFGRQTEAGALVYRALTSSRGHCQPYVAIALVTLGRLRINSAITFSAGTLMRKHWLTKASKTLERALRCAGIFVETAAEARLLLAQVHWMQGEDGAERESREALALSRQSSCLWVQAGTQRLLGEMLACQQQLIEAADYFDQALKIFRKCEMRLEEARTLQAYGEMLVQGGERVERDYQHGVQYLQEARQVFMNCKAELDVKMVERVLQECGATV